MLERLSFGTAGLATLDNRRLIWKLLDTSLECGITRFDTAPLYGNGTMERHLAPFLRANRARVQVTSKFGLAGRWTGSASAFLLPIAKRFVKSLLPPPVRDARPLSFKRGIPPVPVLTADLMRSSLGRSLKQLGVDRIDWFLMHEARAGLISGDLLEALRSEVEAGTIGRFGAGGEWDITMGLASLPWPGDPILQGAYGFVDNVLGSDTSVNACSPDAVHSVFRDITVVERWLERNADFEGGFPEGEYEAGVTLPRFFLQWALRAQSNAVIIFGARSAARIRENVRSAAVPVSETAFNLQARWLERVVRRMAESFNGLS